MSVTVKIEDPLAKRIQNEALVRKQPFEEVVSILLRQALAENLQDEAFFLTPEEIVAKIQSLPPNPSAYIPPTESLAEILSASIASEPKDEPFDLEAWDQQWDAIEQEMNAITRADDIAEGRG